MSAVLPKKPYQAACNFLQNGDATFSIFVCNFREIALAKNIVAEDAGKVIGAVWTRIMDDYGHIDDETPSFAISLLKDYRSRGIGTQLMKRMLVNLKECGFEKASLAVQKENYAVRMYKKAGFKVIDENAEEYIMICDLQGHQD